MPADVSNRVSQTTFITYNQSDVFGVPLTHSDKARSSRYDSVCRLDSRVSPAGTDCCRFVRPRRRKLSPCEPGRPRHRRRLRCRRCRGSKLPQSAHYSCRSRHNVEDHRAGDKPWHQNRTGTRHSSLQENGSTAISRPRLI